IFSHVTPGRADDHSRRGGFRMSDILFRKSSIASALAIVAVFLFFEAGCSNSNNSGVEQGVSAERPQFAARDAGSEHKAVGRTSWASAAPAATAQAKGGPGMMAEMHMQRGGLAGSPAESGAHMMMGTMAGTNSGQQLGNNVREEVTENLRRAEEKTNAETYA